MAKDEVELLDQFRQDYNRFIEVVTKVVELIRAGRAAEAREMQAAQAAPLADRLERLTNQLVNKAEADMVAGIEASKQAYDTSQWIVIGFALGSIVLALGLGYAISWSLIGPVKEIESAARPELRPATSPSASMSSIATSWAPWRPTSTACARSWAASISSWNWPASTSRSSSPI